MLSTMILRRCALVLSIVSAACMTHRAETADSLGAGVLVRVTRSCQPSRPHEVCPRYSGALVSIDDDTLRLQPGRDDLVETLPAAEVARLEVRRGSQNVILLGVVIGMVGGMVIGGAATTSDCSNDGGSLPCFPPGFDYGALAGAVAGGVVGALIHPDRWSRVAWPPASSPRAAPPQEPSSPP
jgi:hypothetical protein